VFWAVLAVLLFGAPAALLNLKSDQSATAILYLAPEFALVLLVAGLRLQSGILAHETTRAEPTVASDVVPPASIKLVWEEAHRSAEAQQRRLVQLEAKTTPLLGFGLALLAAINAPQLPLCDAARDSASVVAVTGLFATLAGVVPRKWDSVPDLSTFIADSNSKPDVLRTTYLPNLLNMWTSHEAVLRTKMRWFKAALFAYLLAPVVGGLVALLATVLRI
jgi:hypothetical protein